MASLKVAKQLIDCVSWLMSVTRDVFHAEIGPCTASAEAGLEHQARRAVTRSALSEKAGSNAAVGVRGSARARNHARGLMSVSVGR